MNPYITLTDPLKCSKCNLCSVKCEEIHGISRIAKSDDLPVMCIQCNDCKEVCKVNAIYTKNNIAIVDSELCVGCKMCEMVCPVNAMKVENLLAHKCTLCIDKKLIPACIEVCPDKVLAITCDKE